MPTDPPSPRVRALLAMVRAVADDPAGVAERLKRLSDVELLCRTPFEPDEAQTRRLLDMLLSKGYSLQDVRAVRVVARCVDDALKRTILEILEGKWGT